MKINVNEKYVVVDLYDTKNQAFKILKVGAKDFSGTFNFLYSPADFGVTVKPKDEVELTYSIQTETRRVSGEYLDVISNTRLNGIKVLGAK